MMWRIEGPTGVQALLALLALLKQVYLEKLR
jgi:hypothetical protein